MLYRITPNTPILHNTIQYKAVQNNKTQRLQHKTKTNKLDNTKQNNKNITKNWQKQYTTF